MLVPSSRGYCQYNNWLPLWDEWQNMRSVTPRGYVCFRVDEPVVIDGVLDDTAWRYIPWTDYFVDIEGEVKPPPRLRTQAKMAWDDTYFYIAADMAEPHVWATFKEHDSIMYHDNDFEIFIDPDNDNHEYYELEINALNTVWDLMLMIPYRDGGTRVNEWEVPGLKTAVKVYGTLNDPSDNDRGWSVEFAIPWTVLDEYAHKPCPPRNGDLWRVNFSRVEYLPEKNLVYNMRRLDLPNYRKIVSSSSENWVWSPPGVINMHCPERWGYVRFSTGEPGTETFEPDPTEPARTAMHDIYYAQRDYHKRFGRYASGIDELGFKGLQYSLFAEKPVIELDGDGYSAAAVIDVPGAGRMRILIRHDSKITVGK